MVEVDTMGQEFLTTNIKGLDELQRKMEQLPANLARRGLRAALKAGATLFRDAMSNGAPRDTGFLSEHFNFRFKINRNELAGSAFIGPQGKMDYPAFASGAYKIKRVKNGKIQKVGRIAVASVARFFEFGTSKLHKKPFMTQAFESERNAAIAAVAAELGRAVKDIT